MRPDNPFLRSARLKKGWTAQEVSTRLGVSLVTYRRIDRDGLANDLPGSFRSDSRRSPSAFGVTSAAKAPLVLGHL
jgi:hypothetical protein